MLPDSTVYSFDVNQGCVIKHGLRRHLQLFWK